MVYDAGRSETEHSPSQREARGVELCACGEMRAESDETVNARKHFLNAVSIFQAPSFPADESIHTLSTQHTMKFE